MATAANTAANKSVVIRREEALSAQAVAKQLPFVCSHATVVRWMKKGYKGIKLKAVRFGTRWATTQALLDEFIERVNVATEKPGPPQGAAAASAAAALKRKHDEAAAGRKSHRAADAKLRAKGL